MQKRPLDSGYISREEKISESILRMDMGSLQGSNSYFLGDILRHGWRIEAKVERKMPLTYTYHKLFLHTKTAKILNIVLECPVFLMHLMAKSAYNLGL